MAFPELFLSEFLNLPRCRVAPLAAGLNRATMTICTQRVSYELGIDNPPLMLVRHAPTDGDGFAQAAHLLALARLLNWLNAQGFLNGLLCPPIEFQRKQLQGAIVVVFFFSSATQAQINAAAGQPIVFDAPAPSGTSDPAARFGNGWNTLPQVK